MNVWNNIELFGESHGFAVGVVIKNIPAGIKIDNSYISQMLIRRKAGQIGTSSRIEEDKPIILSGIFNGFTTGENICVIFKNENAESSENTRIYIPRPGHADYTASVASKGFADLRGGGAYSGRLTLGLVYAGAIAKQFLSMRDIEVLAKIKSIAYISDIEIDTINPDIDAIMDCQKKELPMISEPAAKQAAELIKQTAFQGDSLASSVECIIFNLPVGLGSNFFESCESQLSQGLFAIPAVKGIQFGKDPSTLIYGSNYNDEFTYVDSKIKTKTNNCGGILGGKTNGMPMYFDVNIKPTPSIAMTQNTVDMKEHENTKVDTRGRNDSCIGIRACAVVESVAALWTMYTLLGMNE